MKRKGHEGIGGGERRIAKGKRRRTGQRTGQRRKAEVQESSSSTLILPISFQKDL